MTLSKLREISNRAGIAPNQLTKALSYTVIGLYAARLTYPIIQRNYSKLWNNNNSGHHHFNNNNNNNINNNNRRRQRRRKSSIIIESKFKSDSSLTSVEDSSKTSDNDEDNEDEDENLIIANFDSNDENMNNRSTNDTRFVLEFGPERTNHVVAKFEELAIRFLRQINRLTGINVDFVIQMIKLVRIMIPKIASFEVLLLITHTVSLMSRTFLSIYVAHLEGLVIKYIVRRDLVQFVTLLSKWLLIAVPATFLNSLIRFLESKLALSFRTRLVDYAYGLYFNNETYYSVSNLDGRLENVDHSLTDDITTFAQHCAHLYSHITKPLLDVAVVGFTLLNMAHEMGAYGTPGLSFASGIIVMTHLILRRCSPPFGSLVAEEARRKGYLRFVHSRVITNSEEIAFYRGGQYERTVLDRAFRLLVQQSSLIFNKRLWYVMLEQLLMKYLWSATGMVVIAMPVMFGKAHNGISPVQFSLTSSFKLQPSLSDDIADRTQYMMTAKNILMSGSDALERLFSSYKELTELAGYSNRVAQMFAVFEEVNRGEFKRESIVTSNQQQLTSATGLPQTNGISSAISALAAIAVQKAPLITFRNGVPEIKGQIILVQKYIRLHNVPIVTPNCDIVVPSLSFTINPGMHLLITGPNGCGKSSLFRILAGLWPVFGGRLERPDACEMFYIPQRPYMSLGTLREQLIYPDSIEKMRNKGMRDRDLEAILEMVHLKQVVSREGGWNAKGDWKDILSGGEKQRMGMARLFYHRPQFALLDECTSAVSIDVEADMYENAKSLGISLITITHRPSLWSFHTHLLQFDGQGGWRLEPLDANCRMTLHQEKENLEQSLSGVPKMQDRLKELCSVLGEDSHLLPVIVIGTNGSVSEVEIEPISPTTPTAPTSIAVLQNNGRR